MSSTSEKAGGPLSAESAKDGAIEEKASAPQATTKTSRETPNLVLNANELLQQQQQSPNSDNCSMDEETIQKILRFWNHPSLQQVSAAQKQEYLAQKGISKEQIYQAWDRLIQTTTTPTIANNSSGGIIEGGQAGIAQNNNTSTSHGINPQNMSAQAPLPNPSSYPTSAYPNVTPPPTAPYSQHHPVPSPDYDREDSQDLDLQASNMAMIATVGGFLGLLAAASVRWLNGGDFVFFPPPSRNNSDTSSRKQDGQQQRLLHLQQQHQNGNHHRNHHDNSMVEEPDEIPTINEEEEDTDEEEEEEDDDDDDAELAQYLSSVTTNDPVSNNNVLQQAMTQFAALSEAMQQQVTLQQRLLQKLTSSSVGTTNNNNVTDKSMQVLRRHASQGSSADLDEQEGTLKKEVDPMLWYKLAEIYAELTCLKRDIVGKANTEGKNVSSELESKLQEILEQLQTALQDIMPPTKTEQKEFVSTPEKETNVVSSPATATSTDCAEEEDDETPSSRAETSQFDNRAESPATPQATSKDNLSIESSLTAKAPNILTLRQAVINLIRENSNDHAALKAGAQIMFLYVSNLSKNPHVPRYRKVFTSNESFQKVAKLPGARDFLHALGFSSKENDKFLEWPPPPEESAQDNGGASLSSSSSQDKEVLVKTYHLAEAAEALKILKMMPLNGDSSEKGDEATLALLEKVLDALPLPPAPSSSGATPETPPLAANEEAMTTLQSTSQKNDVAGESMKKSYAEAATNDNAGSFSAGKHQVKEEEEEEEVTNAVWK